MEKKRILVTGSNGLLGKNTLKDLNEVYEIHAIVHSLPAEPLPNVKYYAKDFVSYWSTDDLPKEIFAVIHLAQSELFREFPNYAMEVFQVNVSSTAKLLDYAKKSGAEKFIFTSTGGIYDTSVGAVNENSPINTFGQLGNYFATKLCSEILTHNYTTFFDVSIIRLFFMYGKEQKRSMLIPRLVDNVKNGNPIKLTKDEGIVINPIHVSDVVKVLENLLLTSGSFTYNVAGPEHLTLKQIADTIGEKLGIEPKLEFSENIADNVLADTELLKTNVYEPQVRFETIIQELF